MADGHLFKPKEKADIRVIQHSLVMGKKRKKKKVWEEGFHVPESWVPGAAFKR